MEYSCSSDDEKELSALDYAREYGLCKPYYNENALTGNLPTPTSDDFDQAWEPSPASITITVNTLMKERLTLNKDGALLLKVVHDFREPLPQEILTRNPQRFARLKQELPVLQTDNELDMINFGSSDMPNLRKLKIPSEVVKEENDEGLGWPAMYFTYPAQFDAQIKAEKFAVSKEVLAHLQDAVRDSYTPADAEQLKEECLVYKLNTTRRPVTPPLMPLSPLLTPYIPSSPANRLPLPSDSSDGVIAEAIALERQIMEADSLTRKSSDSSDSMLLDITHPPQLSPLFAERTSTMLKRRTEDLKIEGPLTPPTGYSDSPMKKLKSVSFPEILHQFIPGKPWVDAYSEDGNEGVDSYFDEAFNDIEPLARVAIRNIENEQLSGADTTARVDIPHVDFTMPVAPWNEYSQRKGTKHRLDDTELGAQMKFLLRVKREEFKEATSWHGVSSLERELGWGIFTTKISKINLEEQLHGETEFNKIIAELTAGSIATSSAQVWKPDGLRILDAEEDEEDIELAEAEDRQDMEALIRKRKLEMEEEEPEMPHKRTPPCPIPHSHLPPTRGVHSSHHWNVRPPVTHVPLKRRSKTSNHQNHKAETPRAQHISLQPPKEIANDLMFGGFSATSALYKFMETRGKAVDAAVSARSAEKSRCSNAPRRQETTALPVRSKGPSSDYSASPMQSRQITNPESTPRLPSLPDNLAPCSFIISSVFLQQRSLTKQIEQLYSTAEIVYRDYDLPHSPTKEADILLSPSTGLVLTTLQQIKQSPLPGQPDCSPVKKRIWGLRVRYERLVVVISQGLSPEMEIHGSSRPDDPRDKEVLTHFESFASQLEGEVLVKYVCGGGQALAHSIVVEMARYGLVHGSRDIGKIKPLAVETTWEIFLRRAGLNPFAAQVIVASLQESFDVQLPPNSSSPTSAGYSQAVPVNGLPAFLMMNEEERVQRFQALMGGSRILKRASKGLDRSWVSAVHGFKI